MTDEEGSTWVEHGFDGSTQEHGHDLCLHGIGSAWFGQPEFMQHLSKHPKIYSVAIPASSVALLLTIIIAAPHMKQLSRRAPADRRRRASMLRTVACVPLVICAAKWLAIMAPRNWKLMFLFASVFEVYVFWNFMQLILSMVTESEEWTEGQVVESLGGEKLKMWAVVPLACCCKPMVDNGPVRKRDLHWQRLLMWQFIVVCPLVTVLDWTEAELVESWDKYLNSFETFSLVCAMYGLFALLEATHQRLASRRCHAKFWTIKGVFIANTAILRACSAKMTYDVRLDDDVCYSAGAMASAWAGMWTSMLCVPLACLSRHAYFFEDLTFDTKFQMSVSDGETSDDTAEDSEEESDE